jgi:hypothetical protein
MATTIGHGSSSRSGSDSSDDHQENSGKHEAKRSKTNGGDAVATALAPAEIVHKERPAAGMQSAAPSSATTTTSSAVASAVGASLSISDGGRAASAAPSHAAVQRPNLASIAALEGFKANHDSKIMACLDLSRHLVTWMLMYPSIPDLYRYCIQMYVKLWADWLDSPPSASVDGSVPEPPFTRTCSILTQFMLRERLKMKLSDSPWKAFSNASLVINNFLFIGAGNCSLSPIMLTPPPVADDNESTDFSFNQRKSLIKQFYEDNNIRFIVNVSGRDDFMRSSEYPISASRTYSAAETSDLFMNLQQQPMEALQTHLNGDHVTVFLVHMQDVEHWPQDQVIAAAHDLHLTSQ